MTNLSLYLIGLKRCLSHKILKYSSLLKLLLLIFTTLINALTEYLGGPNAPHIIELDTILLGDLVNNDQIAEIDAEDYDLSTQGAYLQFPLQAV